LEFDKFKLNIELIELIVFRSEEMKPGLVIHPVESKNKLKPNGSGLNFVKSKTWGEAYSSRIIKTTDLFDLDIFESPIEELLYCLFGLTGCFSKK
jgi:hypothetical protein